MNIFDLKLNSLMTQGICFPVIERAQVTYKESLQASHLPSNPLKAFRQV